MATVMTSRQYSPGQPSLPARNQQSNVTHVRLGHINNQSNNSLQNSERNQPLNTPPHGARRASEGTVVHAQADVPPVPRRIAPQGAPGRRQSFETNSFIDRNTAKAFSDPQRVKQAHISSRSTTTHQEAARSPAPGGQESSATLPRNFHTHDDEPPPLPSSRPPSRRRGSTDMSPMPTSPPSRMQHSNQDAVTSPSTRTSHSSPRKQHSLPDPVSSPPTQTSHQQSRRQQSLPETPRVLNATHSAPRRKTHRSEPIPVSEVSPEMPPSRPRKSSLSSTYIDFEEQYRFHEPNDFPLPDTSKISRNKTYPSLSGSLKRQSEFRERDDKLGPL